MFCCRRRSIPLRVLPFTVIAATVLPSSAPAAELEPITAEQRALTRSSGSIARRLEPAANGWWQLMRLAGDQHPPPMLVD